MFGMTISRVNTAILKLGILIGGAFLFAAPFLKPEFAFLAFVATVPWLFFIISSGANARRSVVWFLVLVYLALVVSLNWLGGFSLPAWVVSPLIYVPLFLPAYYLTRWLRTLYPALPVSLIWGLAFTGSEWLRIRVSPGEIPFCQLGAALVPFTKLIQIADVAGAGALSTAAAVTSGFVFDVAAFFSMPESKQARGMLVRSAGLVVAVFSLMLWYGYRNDKPEGLAPGPRLEIVQSNMPGWRDELESRLKLERAVELTEANSSGRNDFDLAVWPENSLVPKLNEPSDSPLTPVNNLARKLGVPILVDGPYEIREFSERHRAALIEPDGTVTNYSKQLFVPWSEYAPLESTIRGVRPSWADSYLRFIQSRNPSFTPTLVERDAPMTVFRFQGRGGKPVVFGSPICYEVLNPRLVSRWYDVLREDDVKHFFLVNQVNEILIGDSVHNQTLAFCQLRAVEGRVSVIRAANNGISAAIDPNGRVYERLTDPVTGSSTDVAGVFFPQVKLDPRAARTVYARFGDWWSVTCLVASLLLVTFGYLRRRTKKLVGGDSEGPDEPLGDVPHGDQ
jgi:apolipoprotein N-acyltransferase